MHIYSAFDIALSFFLYYSGVRCIIRLCWRTDAFVVGRDEFIGKPHRIGVIFFLYFSLSLSLSIYSVCYFVDSATYIPATASSTLYPAVPLYSPVHIILTVWQCTQALFHLSPGTLTHSFTLNPFPYYLIWIPLSPYACAQTHTHTYIYIHIYIYTYRSKEGRL
jgi:hypothetical protein